MNHNASRDNQSTDERDVRALTEYLTVLPDAPGLFEVVSQSGASYTVDAREGACTCPDFEYRDVICKHLRRVAFATGQRPIPTAIPADAIDEQLGRHVDGGPEADRPVLLADGGVVEAPEFTYHVEPPEQGGGQYVRCQGCGAELLLDLGGKDAMIHREGCPAGEVR